LPADELDNGRECPSSISRQLLTLNYFGLGAIPTSSSIFELLVVRYLFADEYGPTVRLL
jgi:hypothetical protein